MHITGNSAIVDVKQVHLKLDYGILSVDVDFDQPALPVTQTRGGFFLPRLSMEFYDLYQTYLTNEKQTVILIHDQKEYNYLYDTQIEVVCTAGKPSYVFYKQVVKADFIIDELKEKLEKSDAFWDGVHLDYLNEFNNNERILMFWGKFDDHS